MWGLSTAFFLATKAFCHHSFKWAHIHFACGTQVPGTKVCLSSPAHPIETEMNQCCFCLGNEFSVKGSCPILFVTVLQHNPVSHCSEIMSLHKSSLSLWPNWDCGAHLLKGWAPHSSLWTSLQRACPLVPIRKDRRHVRGKRKRELSEQYLTLQKDFLPSLHNLHLSPGF